MNQTNGNGEKISCADCKFCDPQQVIGPNGEVQIGQKQLICKRRPPTVCAIQTGNRVSLTTVFPAVSDQMFCFDFWPASEPLPDHSERQHRLAASD